ncbi:unnamed protein product [Bursaphelenchus xylophilus]|uniref:(pine wood nematode) hypothetical protein n=1 Tax=Bursaphelenchus xylophilus TaxID=6326 RepID=A0A7I8WJA3_BURXY|nr:unnamed protein product [Bursaphelenchus xylophilus]CAG9108511.1 unnamed protein product [Bursaphelenchus xylophilus]
MLRDLLICGKLPADPWNRVHCCEGSVLVLIEFCQVQGPIPLLCFPEDVGPHLNLDQVAIWLMSSENTHGSQTFLYNQLMDLHAIVQHVTLLDITARAFQRPAALAFISSEKPGYGLRRDFNRLVGDALRPFLACNRQMFRSYGENMIDVANEMQHERLNSYYSLTGLSLSPSGNNKIRQVSKQLKELLDYRPKEVNGNTPKRLNLQFLDMYKLVSCYPSFCNCGHNPEDFKDFLEIINEPLSSKLIPFIKLAPCSGAQFKQDFCAIYDLLVHKSKEAGVLFSAGYPVLSSYSESGYQRTKEEEHKEDLVANGAVDIVKISRQFPNENSLRCLGATLIQCLYPLLSGEEMAVIASEQRLSTGIDLLQKLNSLKISRVFENAEWCNDENDDRYMTQLRGFTVSRDKTSEFVDKSSRKVIVDLNNQRLYSQFYEGQLLQPLTMAKAFPSDQSLILFILSILADFCFFAQIGKRISVDKMGRKLQLKKQDVLIVANILAEYDIERFLRMVEIREADDNDTATSDTSQPSTSHTSRPSGVQRMTFFDFLKRDPIYTAIAWLRILSLYFTINYLLFLAGLTSGRAVYYKVIMAAAASYAFRLHQRLKENLRNIFSREFVAQLFFEDSAHYLLYSIVFINSQTVTMALFPISGYSLYHTTLYLMQLSEAIGQTNAAWAKAAGQFRQLYSNTLLSTIACVEIFLFPVLAAMIFTGKASFMFIFLYYRFLWLRYTSRRNPHTRLAFQQLKHSLLEVAERPACPGLAKTFIFNSISVVERFAPAV